MPELSLILSASKTPVKTSSSSVKVPVLSKQTVSTVPPDKIFGGLMQWIYLPLRVETAKVIDKFMATVSAGGIAIVIMSRNLTATIPPSTPTL
jgi:hypothetical protein